MIRRPILLLLVTVQACVTGPVDWSDSVEPAANAMSAPAPATLPTSAGLCVNSVRTAGSAGATHATWWSVRPDQSADLMSSTSTDGRSWSGPVRVDSADAGRTGCDRPPPAIAVDGDNVHLAYAMRAREGPGIFLSHSMDRGALFHSPVAVVYGEKPGLASVAARGNFVVVAYEDPNTSPTRISVAISTTMAHLFDFRQVVSPPGGAVAAPLVSTDGSRVVVSWVRASEPGAARISRVGTVR